MPSDGECFGELAAFDFNKIETKAVNVKSADQSTEHIRSAASMKQSSPVK